MEWFLNEVFLYGKERLDPYASVIPSRGKELMVGL